MPIPYTGTYTLEVWGAQGGSCTSPSQSKGGLGGYSKGKKYLTAGSNLYIVIGGTSNTSAGGYNGGGNGAYSGGTYESAPQQALGGGGATHIATRSGLLSSLSNYTNTILIVAAGGGGSGFNGGCNRGTNCYGIGRSTCHVAGGYGGGEYGGNGEDDVNSASTLIGKGASQSGPGSKASNESCGVGSFGKGGDYCNERYGGAGGGGGWYGGGGSSRGHAGGGGGSSYIGGVSNGSMSSGVRSGNGFARITFAQ